MVVAVHGLDTLVGGEVPQLDGHVSATGHCTEGKATVTPSVTTMHDSDEQCVTVIIGEEDLD